MIDFSPLCLEAPDRQVELVVDDDQPVEPVGRDAEPPDQPRGGQARVVDVGLREGQCHAPSAEPDLGHQRPLPSLPEPFAVPGGKELDHIGAHVVPSPRVLGAGVAQPEHEQVGGRAGAGSQHRTS